MHISPLAKRYAKYMALTAMKSSPHQPLIKVRRVGRCALSASSQITLLLAHIRATLIKKPALKKPVKRLRDPHHITHAMYEFVSYSWLSCGRVAFDILKDSSISLRERINYFQGILFCSRWDAPFSEKRRAPPFESEKNHSLWLMSRRLSLRSVASSMSNPLPPDSPPASMTPPRPAS